MMKKKTVLTAALALAVTSILAVGGSLAYFTDTDDKENTFTLGDVDIKLEENFEQESKLYPGEEKDAVTKEVTVKNIGSEDAYVRVHIAVPAELDDNEYIHVIKAEESWTWAEDNKYTTTIDGLSYNVYVATYDEALAAYDKESDVYAETLIPAISKVYMDKKVTNTIVSELEEKGVITGEGAARKLNIKVMAEGVQTLGFDTPAEAFTAALPYSGTSNPFVGYTN